MKQLSERVRNGHAGSLARLISLIENAEPQAVEVLETLEDRRGSAQIIGITGPPGSGKSTLTNRLVGALRDRGETVGVLAVDPSSTFTGGALLGDRTRMQSLATDPGVYIRSMGTRGSLGGLSRAVFDAITAVEGSGKTHILVETVGVGQSEIEIASIADTVLVLFVPGLGDDIQAIKAGITEIGDIFVVNKADLKGASRIKTILENNLELEPTNGDWKPPVMLVSAETGDGLAELVHKMDCHFRTLSESGRLHERRKRRHQGEVVAILQRCLADRIANFYDKQSEKKDVDVEKPRAVANAIWESLTDLEDGGE